MNDYSQETLRKIEQNELIELGICNDSSYLSIYGRFFTSSDGDDYCRLGSCIGNNSKLKTLNVKLEGFGLSITDSRFFEGIKQNSSINKFKLSGFSHSGGNIRIGEVGCEVLKALQGNNNLTCLHIWCCDITNGEDIEICATLQSCIKLNELYFTYNDITEEQLFPMVEALRGNRLLKVLDLEHNRISNTGCEALATLLEDPNCNIHTLILNHNRINNEGAIAIANSLANNMKLNNLDLYENQFYSAHIA